MTQEMLILAKQFIAEQPVEAAQELGPLGADQALKILGCLDESEAAAFVPFIPRYLAANFLEGLPANVASRVVNSLPIDVAASVCRGVERSKFEAMVDIDALRRSRIHYLMDFDQNSAGALIDPTVLSVSSSDTLEVCFMKFKEKRQKAIYYLYVVDGQDRLLGVVTIKELLNQFNEKNRPISSIMSKTVFSIRVDASIMSVINNDGWNQFHALPVVDHNGGYLGVIRYETMKRVEVALHQKSRGDSVQVSSDLGELYSVGLSALIRGTSTIFTSGEEN